jgi:hypothetical protein
MPTTSSHLLPYPEATDPADVPADIAALAEALDTKLDTIAPAQITGPTSGQLLIANASGVVTGTAVSGDVVISNTGDAQIQAGAVGTNELGSSAVTTAKIDGSAVTTDKLNNAAVTAAKIAASTTALLTFSNGASAADPGAPTARKYADGLVTLTGAVIRVSPSQNTVYATLPAGYRPATELRIPITVDSRSTIAEASIATNGEIRFFWLSGVGTPGVGFYLDGIALHAA